jgi:hypothetical protein
MRVLYEKWHPQERNSEGGAWFDARRQHSDERNALFVESQVVGRGIERPPDKVVVVFFSSSGDEISELDVDWSEYFFGQPGALQAVAQICHEDERFFLVVRTHPHKRMKPRLDVNEWHSAVKAANPDLHLDEWSDVDSYTLMDQADVVVTFGSTTGVEAAYAGKPVVVLGPSAYDELGCATRARTLSEIRTALVSRTPGSWSGAVSYGLMMNKRGFNFECVQSDVSRQQLCGVVLRDSSSIPLKMSHWWGLRGLQQAAAH